MRITSWPLPCARPSPGKKLYDSQIFAIRHSDGQLSYCSVMGHSGDHLALALYPGESGLHSLISIYNSDYETMEPYLSTKRCSLRTA